MLKKDTLHTKLRGLTVSPTVSSCRASVPPPVLIEGIKRDIPRVAMEKIGFNRVLLSLQIYRQLEVIHRV